MGSVSMYDGTSVEQVGLEGVAGPVVGRAFLFGEGERREDLRFKGVSLMKKFEASMFMRD